MSSNYLFDNHLLKACLAAVFALGLTACSSSGSGTPDDDDDAMMTPQQMCEADGGTWANDDCMTAADTQHADIDAKIKAATAAVAGVNDDSTDGEVSAAEMAVAAAKKAIADADAVSVRDKATYTTAVNTAESLLNAAKMARMEAMDAAATAKAKADAKLGKDLRAALGGAAANTNALANVTAITLGMAGLDVTAADDAGALTGAVTVPTLKAGESAGALGSWMGTNYAHTDTGTKVENSAIVYTNQGPGTREAFADVHDVHTDATAGDDLKGYYTVDESADFVRFMGAAFTHSGTQTHMYDPDTEVAFTTRGTYDGAPGLFRCTGTCMSTNDGSGAPSALGGVWHFKPDSGAMVHQPDEQYLYYGWWLNKDKDGKPMAASAFTGRVGADSGDSTDGLNPGWGGSFTADTTLTGSATYAGHAAGKVAMSNPLDGTGSGGHFTADAMLEAKFGATDTGVTGTIDNFMVDGAAMPWSVALQRAPFGDDGAITAPVDDTGTNDVNEAMSTIWSINDNPAPRSGTWSGMMYDEAVHGDADDGSNIPTTVTGTFYSEFSTIGRMVGAFGADKE